jgi:hypothetical protein
VLITTPAVIRGQMVLGIFVYLEDSESLQGLQALQRLQSLKRLQAL